MIYKLYIIVFTFSPYLPHLPKFKIQKSKLTFCSLIRGLENAISNLFGSF